ncbi:MAG: phosphoglycerate dehydrogenase [Treponema succinifaciens]|uniref:phosphoglycerate dehydrogenase n=1 Tax=Treponema succinifaciens TaxID=167 RepID=UPI0023552D62|nr:phosphoglycerate dehydrogenase [Treponema succinifaciens]MCI6911599.1 phosphoglycerate dehydrogenase [Treponema succinifaciens]UKI56026.1 MAG: phosphoglycerate dehydrogenase [Treponema succinifaciens]
MFKIQTLDRISAVGLDNFPRDEYEIASEIVKPDAILVRSHDMLSMEIDPNIKAVARAGAGVNNIPVKDLAQKGVVVFNTPGANANAVKELVILGLLMASRPVIAANQWVNSLAGKGAEIATLAEKGKKNFIGQEVKGKTLGVIGLGAIGAQVANTAVELGMNVIGYDPFLSVDAAWSLNHQVKHAETLDTLLAKADYLTFHVPETPDTKGFVNANTIKNMKNGVKLINIARGGLVNNEDVLAAIRAGKISCMVTDFAAEELIACDKVICLPHLGASTPEAEDNCAVMAVKELRDFLERGIIKNSVNFPKTTTDNPIPCGGTRLCISHKNEPGLVAQFTTILGEANLNIEGMVNQNRCEVAYNIIDVAGKVTEQTLENLAAIKDVTKVRPIYN